MQRLRECLDVVEIVISFLSSEKRGGTANTELKGYVKKVLRMEKKFTSKKVCIMILLIANLPFCAFTGNGVLYTWSYPLTLGDHFSTNGKDSYITQSSKIINLCSCVYFKNIFFYFRSHLIHLIKNFMKSYKKSKKED